MQEASKNHTGWGLIAGNGTFPFLVLEGARSQGIEMAVLAIRKRLRRSWKNRRSGSSG